MHARPSNDKILLIKYENYAEVGKNNLSLQMRIIFLIKWIK